MGALFHTEGVHGSLLQLIERLAELPDDATLYAARPWSPESDAVAAIEGPGGESPTELPHLLEVELAREAVDVWSEWRKGRRPTAGNACAAVIHYATHDAYMPMNIDT
ncbi:hypothetical protein [Micromonospora ureilytica]|uniref:Uncharacterized protein n=1 Tax=Micromonospora ureilytica TaxID=709868 RepID=A0ABS0JH20_9ACTN|nr:hypothetical protein [Micromonospora ureilytica]MBG6066358.1 hypothetical protein [Micromonospora ureilytica]WSR53922.1 hypothetical protein OG400_19145 [Micromonospora ureilytica]